MTDIERDLRDIIKFACLKGMCVHANDTEMSLECGRQIENLISEFLIKYNSDKI